MDKYELTVISFIVAWDIYMTLNLAQDHCFLTVSKMCTRIIFDNSQQEIQSNLKLTQCL